VQPEGIDREWHEWLERLGAFREQFGHCQVPPKWTGIPGLARWVAEQRNRFHLLDVDRLQQLNEFGFDFGGDRYWISRFLELVEFRRIEGHCNVPIHWPKNPQLGGWLSGQRTRKDSIPVARRTLLEKIGMDWSPLETQWNQNYEDLVKFKEAQGHCNVPVRWPENPQLALWVGNLRQRRRRLTPLQKRKLDRLGFDWAPGETLWKNHLRELVQFKKQHGHCNVPPHYAENTALGTWVVELRERGKDRVPAKWRRQLHALQFEWSPMREQWWEARFTELRAYKKQFGDCRVPKGWPPNPGLGDWVGTQRSQQKQLSADRRRRLTKLGFTWRVNLMSPMESWEERFQELVAFHQRFGHCEVPRPWPENKALAEWVRRQRGRDEGNLSVVQRQRLNEIGYRWNPRDSNWEQRFNELKSFWKANGHCNVPRDFKKNTGLRGWVLRQRYRKETLGADRVRKLDGLKFRWLGPNGGQVRSPVTGRFVENEATCSKGLLPAFPVSRPIATQGNGNGK